MTKLVFETATLADSLKKAFACTPKKGAAFDKAAGIVFEFNPTDLESVTIRATNLDVYYMEWVDLVEGEGPDEPHAWRFNSQLIASVVGSLPIGSGKTVSLEEKEGVIHLSAGRTKCRFNLINMDHYPVWGAFDPDDLTATQGFAGRMEQVEWAVDSSHEILQGVHFDGEFVYATNKYRLAVSELKVDLSEPVTLPSGILSGILSKTAEILVGGSGSQFYIMPDEHTQIRTVIYAGKYLNTSRVIDQIKPNQITFKKGPLLEMVSRALNFAGSDRTPTMTLYIGMEEVAVMMANEEMGMLGDVLEVPGQADHPRVVIRLTPDYLSEALAHSPNEEISLGYDCAKPDTILYIDGGSGYRAWVMPRTENKNG